ncbi:15025_t:CDS:2, partial [Entrophospora sp. SA101]
MKHQTYIERNINSLRNNKELDPGKTILAWCFGHCIRAVIRYSKSNINSQSIKKNSEFKFYNDLDVIFDANEANDFIKDIDTCIKLDNGYGYNPLYNPQLRKYLDNTWWKTVVFWSNLIPPIKDRTQRTTATVEVENNIIKSYDVKKRNLDIDEYLYQ